MGFPEATSNEEVANETVYQFLERELELEGVRDIEFQRVHRIGKKKAGAVRPIIARFLRFPDHERIFRRALEVRDVTEVRVFTDLPKEIDHFTVVCSVTWPLYGSEAAGDLVLLQTSLLLLCKSRCCNAN